MASSSNPRYPIPNFRAWPAPAPAVQLITTAAVGHGLRDALRRRVHLGFVLRSSIKSISHQGDVFWSKSVFDGRAIRFTGFNCLNALSSALMNLSFFNGDGKRDSKELGKQRPITSRRNLFDGRQWTNILLAANVLVYIAQYASNGRLLYWGAKINGLISEGQLWRLATSSFLHANIGHLLVNCYSLNSIGPTVENICGPRRFLTVYITSAITGSTMSYWLSKAPSVGASGAIFGLVGSFALFILRHRGMVKGTEGDLKHIARVIVLNLSIGLLSQGIDNWGHVGGLIGGAAVSWLVGPAWEFEPSTRNGRRSFTDKAPIFSLFRRFVK